MKVAVLGSGSWGTALAKVLVENGHSVQLWGRDRALVDAINSHQENEKYLKGVQLPQALKATDDLQQALNAVDLILFVVPTKAIRNVAKQVNDYLSRSGGRPVLVHASKGIEIGSHLRISQMLEEEINPNHYRGLATLSGPSHAEEVSREMLTMVTAASQSLSLAQEVQGTFMNQYLRVYTNTDLLGVELGGALKNVIAIASGIIEGLGYGDNSRAALITRGLAEISRLGIDMGADPLTFSGLSGLGDLIVTATSSHSRNYQAGVYLGQGFCLEDVQNKINMVIEGLSTCQAAYELSLKRQVEMPITKALYQLLYQEAEVETLVKLLMQREGKSEARVDHFI